MSVRVFARVTDAYAAAGSGVPATQQVNIHVTASDDTNTFAGTASFYPTNGMTVVEINEGVVEAALAAVAASTPATTYSWVVDRNNFIISGLFQRA